MPEQQSFPVDGQMTLTEFINGAYSRGLPVVAFAPETNGPPVLVCLFIGEKADKAKQLLSGQLGLDFGAREQGRIIKPF